jgi:molybdopterin synthase catalytic subunit
MIRVRLFAALRELAGASVVEVEPVPTVGALLAELGSRYGDRFSTIANAGSVVIDGRRAGPDTELTGGEEVAVLPPVSGGDGLSSTERASRPSGRGRRA